MHMYVSGQNVKCIFYCGLKLKKKLKSHFSKGKETDMFLFNKLDSPLALFEDSVIAS